MPDFHAEIRARLASLRMPPAQESDIVDELSQHLDDVYRDARHRGLSDGDAIETALEALSSDAALARALRGTGRIRGTESVAIGQGRRGNWLGALGQDLAFGLRLMRVRPGFSAAAILLVGLGIAATATTFSVVNTVLLKPLPFPRSEQLIAYWGTAPDKGLPQLDLPDGVFTYHREHTKTLQSVAAYDDGSHTITGQGDPERVRSAWVSYNFFTVLAVPPALGRAFTRDEERPNGGLVVILSDALWRGRSGASWSTICRTRSSA